MRNFILYFMEFLSELVLAFVLIILAPIWIIPFIVYRYVLGNKP